MTGENSSWHCDHTIAWDFPVDIHRSEHQHTGPIIECHWHENFEIMYFEQGEAVIYCNSQPLMARPGDVIIINSNDLHYGESLSAPLIYYVVEFDFSFIHSSQIDLCQTKYLTPLVQNRLLFRNQLDSNDLLLDEVRQLISEYSRQELGYELAVKAYIYRILVLLLRCHDQQLISETEKNRQRKVLNRLSPVLKYMDTHYTETLSLKQLSTMAAMSSHYFCRLFKSLTGKSPTEYINRLRINKAVSLLSESELNITEIALAVGFTDSNYFSRMFKKYKHVSPSKLLP